MGPRERRRWGVRRGEARPRLRRAPQARPPERSGATGPRERRRWGVRWGEAPRLINERGDGAPRATALGGPAGRSSVTIASRAAGAPAGAERGDGGPASDGAGGSGGAKPPG